MPIHIHYKGHQIYNDGAHTQTDNEWHVRLNKPSVWAVFMDILNSLTKTHAVQLLSVDYRVDKNAATEHLKVEATPYEDINSTTILVIYSCHCDENWESKGKPPF